MKFIDKVSPEMREYFEILEPVYPEWIDEYIYTKRLLNQQYVSVTCGKVYSKLFNMRSVSSLEHSVAVALIIWHFTRDKKQTLAGLFHDIATPSFKHCVDFMNGDYMKQESTEDLTQILIKESDDVMRLLERDNIKLEEICDYHIYPIADNDTPKLSADRLEYSLSNGVFVYDISNIDEIREIYNDIEVQENEDGIIELGFKTKKIARKFVKNTSELSVLYRDNETRFFMQVVADILKRLSDDNVITKRDLYELKESEVIDIIKKSEYGDVFNRVLNATEVNVSKEKPEGVYYVHHGAKIRYIDPLVNGKRISEECKIAKRMIDNNLNYDMDWFVYLDFDLECK